MPTPPPTPSSPRPNPGRPPYQPARPERRPPLPPKPTANPRRVVGGVRLQTRVGPIATAAAAQGATTAAFAAGMSGTWGWASSRWMRLAENHAPGEQLAEGLEYARLGQTRSLEVRPGSVSARVQGRMPGAYKVEIRLPAFTAEQWERVLAAMAEQARYGAPLASGELPSNIEDLFAPLGLRLFPAEAPDLATSCTCEVFRGGPGRAGGTPWCKHVCCAMFLIAERLGREPLLIFALRGLPEQELLERLRQQRALVGAARTGGAAVPVHAQHVAGAADPQSPWNRPLEEAIDEFWGTGERGRRAIDSLEVPLEPPAVTHPLLRRLGPSPWAGQAGAKFPLVGLLATCYDVVSQSVLRDAGAQGET